MLHNIHSNNLTVFLFKCTHNFFFLICIALIKSTNSFKLKMIKITDFCEIKQEKPLTVSPLTPYLKF